MTKMTPTQTFNAQLHEFFIQKYTPKLYKYSLAFMKAWDMRSRIMRADISESQENKLLSKLKVIYDLNKQAEEMQQMAREMTNEIEKII